MKNLSIQSLLNLFLCMFPLSIILGSLILNINLLFFLITSIIYIKQNKLKIEFNLANILLISFFTFVIITTIYNYTLNGQGFILKSLLILRFLILYLILEILIINNSLKLKNLFITSLCCTSFVCIDLIIQYKFGYNLFGFEAQNSIKYNGVFYDKSVTGSYIQRISLFSIFGLLLFLDNKTYKNKLLFLIILLHGIGILIAPNRTSYVFYLLSIILLIFFAKNIRIYIFASIITLILITGAIFDKDPYKKEIYKVFFSKVINFDYALNLKSDKKILNENLSEDEKISARKKLNLLFTDGEDAINRSAHGAIYLTAIESWKKNKLIGNGYRSFRINCWKIMEEQNVKYDPNKVLNQKLRCSNHPHNYHLEVLHDTGIIGFLLITIFVFVKIYELLKIYFSSKNNHLENLYIIPILLAFLIEIWPIKPSGMLFTSWNGTITWLIVALTSIKFTKIKN